MTTVLLAIFWAMQVVAQLFFKWGSATAGRWVPGFILGNLFGASSIWLMMKLYTRMNPNLALALAGGGAFLVTQLALALVFHSRPTGLQWVGFAAVGAGMALASFAAKPESA
jgi:drug/metabolite transporter (DMT)-like permease